MEAQLAWVAAELGTPALEGSLPLVHRPPMPTALDLAVPVELREQSGLEAVLAGRACGGSCQGTCIVRLPRRADGFGGGRVVERVRAVTRSAGRGFTRDRLRRWATTSCIVRRDDVHSVVGLEVGADVGEQVAAEEAERRIAGRGIERRERVKSAKH
jgi:hypothetical protein